MTETEDKIENKNKKIDLSEKKCANLGLDKKRKVFNSKSFNMSYELTNLTSGKEELVREIKGILDDHKEMENYRQESLTGNKNCEEEASSRIWFASEDWITDIKDTIDPLPFHDETVKVKNGSISDSVRTKICSENLVIKKPVQKACSWNTSIADSAGIKLDYRYTSAGLEPIFLNPITSMIRKEIEQPEDSSTESSESFSERNHIPNSDFLKDESKKLLEPFSGRKPSSCSLEVALKSLNLERSSILPSI